MRNALTFHIFFRTKYRRAELSESIASTLEAIGPALAVQFGAEVLAFAIHDDDHVHLLVNLPATKAPADFCRDWKSATSRRVNPRPGEAFWQKRFLIKPVVQTRGNIDKVIQYINRYK